MVLSLPILIGAWARVEEYTWNRVLFAVSIGVAVLGVFMCASRSQAVILIVLVIVSIVVLPGSLDRLPGVGSDRGSGWLAGRNIAAPSAVYNAAGHQLRPGPYPGQCERRIL